jgi:hypothetical protein
VSVEREVHPVAAAFPLLEGPAFDALVRDIAAQGLREAITLHPDGSVLDGRNRDRACLAAGVAPRFETWDGAGSEIAFVTSKNLCRRHLSENQRALVAARLATLEHGGARRGIKRPIGPLKIDQAAQALNVGPRTVRRARKVLAQGTPELIAAVEEGRMSVSKAAAQAGEDRPRPETPANGKAGRPNGAAPARRSPWRHWRRLDEALEHLNGLPAPADVNIHPSKRAGLARRVAVALRWLQSFEEEWNDASR